MEKDFYMFESDNFRPTFYATLSLSSMGRWRGQGENFKYV
jgi:hypothetical protein